MIRVPYQFDGDPHPVEKLFVVIGHRDEYAICIKATSKTAVFRNNPSMRKGCVWYDAGVIPCFPLDTAIEPDNQIPIPHEVIRRAHCNGTLQIHELPPQFEDDLRGAIGSSATLSMAKRIRILAMSMNRADNHPITETIRNGLKDPFRRRPAANVSSASHQSLMTQGGYRIDPRRVPCRNQAGDKCDQQRKGRDTHVRGRIEWRHIVE